MASSFAARPEARWALWAGVFGAIAATALSVKGIFASGGSTAAIGFIFVPLVAAVAAIPFALWGAALGHVVARLRGHVHEPALVFVSALVAALALPLAAGYEVWRGNALEVAVHEALHMNAAELERAFDGASFRRDRFYLGALAQNRAASPTLLERIATLEDPNLFEPMGSLWNVKGENRKGLAVMRLVAGHANATRAVRLNLAHNPAAPAEFKSAAGP